MSCFCINQSIIWEFSITIKHLVISIGYYYKQLVLPNNNCKRQPHEGELTGWIVDELRIRRILGEQPFSSPFVTGGRSHRNRRRLQRRPMTTRNIFWRNISIVHACKTNAIYWTLLLNTLAANKHSFHRAAVWHHGLACRKLWRCVRLDYHSRVAEALARKL